MWWWYLPPRAWTIGLPNSDAVDSWAGTELGVFEVCEPLAQGVHSRFTNHLTQGYWRFVKVARHARQTTAQNTVTGSATDEKRIREAIPLSYRASTKPFYGEAVV